MGGEEATRGLGPSRIHGDHLEGRRRACTNTGNEHDKTKLSAYLSDKLHLDYNHLSQLFSSIEGLTIEQYFIHQRIEKAKELLVYDELSVTQIADRLGYSSVAHLCSQFKKTTGLTPSHFRELKDSKKRLPIDKL